MVYLEFLRVRRVFVCYAAVLVVAVLFVLVGAIFGSHVNVNVNVNNAPNGDNVHIHGLSSLGAVPIPVDAIVGIAAFCTIVLAAALGGSFNRETAYAHFTFVRPLSRVRMALLVASVDVVAILLGGLFAVALGFIAVSGSIGGHAHYIWMGDDAVFGLLAFGTAFMWYGLLQAVTAWAPGRALHFIGIAVTILVLAFPLSRATMLGPIANLFGLILYIDPLAYFTGFQVSGAGVHFNTWLGGPIALRAFAVWLLGFASLGLATVLWKRVEV